MLSRWLVFVGRFLEIFHMTNKPDPYSIDVFLEHRDTRGSIFGYTIHWGMFLLVAAGAAVVVYCSTRGPYTNWKKSRL